MNQWVNASSTDDSWFAPNHPIIRHFSHGCLRSFELRGNFCIRVNTRCIYYSKIRGRSTIVSDQAFAWGRKIAPNTLKVIREVTTCRRKKIPNSLLVQIIMSYYSVYLFRSPGHNGYTPFSLTFSSCEYDLTCHVSDGWAMKNIFSSLPSESSHHLHSSGRWNQSIKIITQSMSELLKPSMNQSMKPSMNQSIDQPIFRTNLWEERECDRASTYLAHSRAIHSITLWKQAGTPEIAGDHRRFIQRYLGQVSWCLG